MKNLLFNAVDLTAFFYALFQFEEGNIFSVFFLAFQVLIIFIKLVRAIVKFFKTKNKSELDKEVSQIRDDILEKILKGDIK